MGNASNAQTSFLSGEWSPYAQGNFADPEYKRGMNVCRNIWPIETGAATRRTGTRFLGFTRKGQRAMLIPFSFSQSAPYTMEFTDTTLRFRDSQGLVLSEEPRRVAYINQATPAVMTTTTPCAGQKAWATGDTVIFNFLTSGASAASGVLVGKQFSIVAGSDANHWSLYDAVTGTPVNGATINWSKSLAIQVGRIFELPTPYDAGAWSSLRAVQDGDSILLLHPNFQPQSVFAPIDGGAAFTINPAQFIDGPYFDPPTDGSYLTTSGTTGSISMTLTYPAWSSSATYPNGTRFFTSTQTRAGLTSTSSQYQSGAVVASAGGVYVSLQDQNTNHTPASSPTWWQQIGAGEIVGPNGFTANDVGRSIRLLSEPFLWAAGTAYTTGNLVKYSGAYYVALQNSTGAVPGTDAVNWGVASNASKWTWGIITSVGGATSITVEIQGADLLYNQNVYTYRLGVYAASTTWPSCGTFHEGRFWLGGAVKNRFDASGASGNTYNFAPTAEDGTVSDANAISYTLNSPQQDKIIWMIPDHEGIVMGTAQGEWLVQSSANNNPITPTSIQAHNVTKLGSANVEPHRMGITLAFVQRFGNKIFDYVCDLFSSKFAGLNMSERAKHLVGGGIVKLAYQHELVPILWALTANNQLIGTTFKRESSMVSQAPNFNGWHHHDLGSGFSVIDLVMGASPSGLLDAPVIVTQDPVSGTCRVETITELFDENSTINDSWFLDNASVPCGGVVGTVGGKMGVTLSGFAQLNGFIVTASIAGLDCGDYLVANGQIFVPFGSDPDGSFTLAFLQALSAKGFQYGFTFTNVNNSLTQTMLQFPPISNTFLSHFTYLNYGNQSIPDWKRDRVSFLLPGTGPYSGIVQYKISTGALIQYQNISYIYGINDPAYYDNTVTYTVPNMVLGSDNKLYVSQVNNSLGVDPTSAGQVDWNLISVVPGGTLPSAYNAGTTYSIGQFVTSAGNVYASLINGNIGNTPASSPADWDLYWSVPASWVSTTVYSIGVTYVTGSNDEIYWNIRQVPAGLGDPSSFPANANKYWQTTGSVFPHSITTQGLGMDFNGDIYMYQGGNFGQYVKVNGTTLQATGFIEAAPGNTIPAPSNGVCGIRILNNHFQAEEDFILETCNATPLGVSNPSAVLMGVTSLVSVESATFIFDEGNSPIACSGLAGPGVGKAYVLTRPVNGPSSITPVGLYEIAVYTVNPPVFNRALALNYKGDPNAGIWGYQTPNGPVQRKAGTISPSQIDPLWVFFAGFNTLLYDQKDGNVMTFVKTQNPATWTNVTSYAQDATILSYALGSDNNVYHAKAAGTLPNPVTDGGVHWTLVGPAAVNLCYLVKFASDCAGTIWTTPVNAPPTTDISGQFCDISTGWYVFEENLGAGTYQGRRINTLTGESQIFAVGGTPPLGASQTFSGTLSQIIIYPQYDSTQPNAPTPVGATPSTFVGWGVWTIPPANYEYTVPGVVGFTYTSQGQLLRPVSPQESGTRNGPAFGKNRRNHRYAVAVANTQGCSFGSTFSNLHTAKFASAGGTVFMKSQLYTGEHSATIEDTYSYDGMLCWQVTRPYPTTVLALGGFLETADR